MFRFKLVILFLVLSTGIAMANCSDDTIGAKYKITTSDIQGNNKRVTHLTLWRSGNRVAHEHINTRITEVWEQLKNKQLRLIRNFDEHKRGIEYEPNEIKIDHNAASWQLKKQLVSQSLIDNMELQSTSKKGCDLLQLFVKESNNNNMKLEWLPQQKLVSKFTIVSKKEMVSWKLLSVEKDKRQVENLFNDRLAYQTTDYTDIGDNESDPFLMKMINLGFVSHGASGIYDQHGNVVEGSHKH